MVSKWGIEVGSDLCSDVEEYAWERLGDHSFARIGPHVRTCLVTGDDLDEMDERVATVYDGQVFEFCCKPCLTKFNKNPGKYVKLLAEAKG